MKFGKTQFKKSLVIVSLLGSSLSTAAHANIIQNGDFSEGARDWRSYLYEREAQASFEIGGTYEDGRVTISDGGEASWHIQLIQDGFLLEKGKTYRLQFDYTTSSKSADGDIEVVIEENGGDYTQYMLAEHLEAGPGLARFDKQFTMTHQDDYDTRISFNLGNNQVYPTLGAVIWVDNVSLVEVPPESEELIQNGDFSLGKEYWTSFIHRDADASFRFENGVVWFSYVDGGSKWWHSQIYSAPLSLRAGTTYRLEFDYTSSSRTTTAEGAVVVENGKNYRKYLERIDFYPNPGNSKFVTEFVQPVDDDNARVTFNFGDAEDHPLHGGALNIDNVSLKAVSN